MYLLLILIFDQNYVENNKSFEEFDFINRILTYYEILDLLFIDKNPVIYYNQKELYEI